MRKKAVLRILIYLALGVLLLGAKCPGVPGTEDIEMTLVTEEFIEFTFQARGSINVDSGFEEINVDQLRLDLEEAGIEVSMIDTIRVASVQYGTVDYYEPVTDREIFGASVTVERSDTGASQTLISNYSEAVYPLLGILKPAPINEAGIDFLNDLMADLLVALKDYSASSFEVRGTSAGTSNPQERYTNFDWRLRIYYHVSGRYIVTSVTF